MKENIKVMKVMKKKAKKKVMTKVKVIKKKTKVKKSADIALYTRTCSKTNAKGDSVSRQLREGLCALAGHQWHAPA